MTKANQLSLLLALGASTGLVSCATSGGTSNAKLDPKTTTVLDAMSAKLSAAKTLRVNTTRTNSAGFYTGVSVAQSASGTVAVERPNKFAAHLKTSEGNRDFGFDGSTIIVVDHKAGTHGTVKAAGDIDRAVNGVAATYGVTPLLGELLANNPKAILLEGVKTGKYVGTDKVGATACDHLSFTQDGQITWELWVATSDQLPRRITMTYPNGEGGAPLTMTSNMSNWQLNTPLSANELTIKAPSGSRELEMIPLHP
jgi:hypothetical protein